MKGAFMSLPSSIDTAFVRQYASTLYVLAQQRKSKLVQQVRNEGCQGESKSFDRIGEAEVQEITGRHSDTPNNEQPHTRRWVTPTNYDTNSYVDDEDKLKMLINPTNEYMQNQARALGRQSDDIIIAAALGTAAAGVTPTTTTVAFKDESVSINGDGTVTSLGTLATEAGGGSLADMTLAKMATMQQLFDDEDVDEEIPRMWAVTPKDIRAMLQIQQLTSSDYANLKPLEAGKIVFYVGFNFIRSTRLTKDAATSTAYRTIAWAKDGIIYASGKMIESHIDQLPTKRYTTQVYSKMNGGAVRMEGAKVHECLNKVA
ncbi:MAG: hypothetical protein GY941_21665 [Planctomycetes bacterium]|nr:hypothetical protein [Planctomycetota bacterium]